jgi:hypothetical protein
LLTSDFEPEDVAAASMLGPAGAVPTGLTGVVELAVSDIVGFLGAEKSLSLQPISKVDSSIAQSRTVDFFMAGSNIFLVRFISRLFRLCMQSDVSGAYVFL